MLAVRRNVLTTLTSEKIRCKHLEINLNYKAKTPNINEVEETGTINYNAQYVLFLCICSKKTKHFSSVSLN